MIITFKKNTTPSRAHFCSEFVFLGWKVRCAEELAPDLFKWLLDIEESPVPSKLHTIGLYEEEGIRIL